MKKFGVGIAALICLGVFIIFGILAAVTVSNIGFDGIKWRDSDWINIGEKKEYDIDQTLSYSQDEIARLSSISISGVSADITVTPGDDFTVHLYGNYRSSQELELIHNENNGRLEIKVHYPSFGVSFSTLKMDVTLPQSYVKDLSLSSVSGDIKMNIPDKELEDLQLSSTSGGIRCEITSCDLQASSVSGSIRSIVQEGNINASSTSGSIKCTTGAGDILASSVSGSVTAKSGQFNIIDAHTTSGDIDITVSKDSSFKVTFDSVSGSFNSVMPLSVTSSSKRHFEGTFGNGDGSIKANSVSGSCQINYE